MSIILNAPIGLDHVAENETKIEKFEDKLAAFLNRQAKYVTAWFMLSMLVQGVFFLPLPALLVFQFGAPTYILAFTLGLFFANLIAGMSNSGIRTIIYLFAASILVNLSMLLIFAL